MPDVTNTLKHNFSPAPYELQKWFKDGTSETHQTIAHLVISTYINDLVLYRNAAVKYKCIHLCQWIVQMSCPHSNLTQMKLDSGIKHLLCASKLSIFKDRCVLDWSNYVQTIFYNSGFQPFIKAHSAFDPRFAEI